MLTKTDGVEQWEQGCEVDIVRNNFVIPEIVRILNISKSRKILDVGCGTGYLARSINSFVEHSTEWTLLDTSYERIFFSKQKCADTNFNAFNHMVGDILSQEWSRKFDAILVAFTILEIEKLKLFFEKIGQVCYHGAQLFIVVPDSWEDVIACNATSSHALNEFLTGSTSLQKVDKFTSTPYPFHAVRNEKMLTAALSVGFELTDLLEHRENQNGVYIFVFRYNGA